MQLRHAFCLFIYVEMPYKHLFTKFCVMKRAYIFFILLTDILSFSAHAQQGNQIRDMHAIGLSVVPFGTNSAIRFATLDGAASYNADKLFTIGFNYSRFLTEKLEIETGLEYSKQSFIVSPLYPELHFLSLPVKLKLVSLPVSARINFAKYFYGLAGILFDIDVFERQVISKQSGIGAQLGFGAKYDFASGVSVFAQPYAKMHALISFQSSKYPERVFDAGLRIGISYQFVQKNK